MRKRIFKILLVSVPIILIVLIIFLRLTAEPSNEQIIRGLRDIRNYTAKVDYLIINTRGEEREETIQYFSKDFGGRIDFGQDRVKIYKDDKILIKDNLSNKEYGLEEDMDKFHPIAFMDKLLENPIIDGQIKDGQEEWGEREYIEFTSELFLNNENLDKIRIFIDKNEEIPIGAVIYDKNGIDKVRIVYKEFKRLKEQEEDLFN
ncbi:germination lipoprotein GerS-related protein [Clostridium sp.]|uniref:germination lipoprotein GerS-related protein n=1 Tax=Clostridium sp. TaxID=1506 RepID=UPI00262DC68D|nr:germination lipoprotein GerS-related protein [Clostridium sp.]